jgi:RNA polymerase sigma-70 factor, ECF subfamily
LATDSPRCGDEYSAVLSSPLALAATDGGSRETQPLVFEAIYAEHFSFVWRCLRALGVPTPLLDDAAQEVFLGVHRGLATFRGDSAVRTWLYGIVRNVAHKQRRTLARRGTSALETEPVAASMGPAEQAQDAQAAAFVRHFLVSLDEKKRDVFLLAMLEELSIPEVAQIVGAPLNTIYTRLRSARAEFRAALEARAGGRGD